MKQTSEALLSGGRAHLCTINGVVFEVTARYVRYNFATLQLEQSRGGKPTSAWKPCKMVVRGDAPPKP